MSKIRIQPVDHDDQHPGCRWIASLVNDMESVEYDGVGETIELALCDLIEHLP